jgi:hypothetical protein
MTPHNLLETFKSLWEEAFAPEIYVIRRGMEHKWAKELLDSGIDTDTIVKRAKIYLQTPFYRDNGRCSFLSFVKNFNQFADLPKQNKARAAQMVFCSHCDKPVNEKEYDRHLQSCEPYLSLPRNDQALLGMIRGSQRGGEPKLLGDILGKGEPE